MTKKNKPKTQQLNVQLLKLFDRRWRERWRRDEKRKEKK